MVQQTAGSNPAYKATASGGHPVDEIRHISADFWVTILNRNKKYEDKILYFSHLFYTAKTPYKYGVR